MKSHKFETTEPGFLAPTPSKCLAPTPSNTPVVVDTLARKFNEDPSASPHTNNAALALLALTRPNSPRSLFKDRKPSENTADKENLSARERYMQPRINPTASVLW